MFSIVSVLAFAAFNCWVFGAPRPLALTLLAGATVALTFGCTNYARGKGFSPLIGLTAIVPPLGLVVVSLLPDRRRQEPDQVMRMMHEAKERRNDQPKPRN